MTNSFRFKAAYEFKAAIARGMQARDIKAIRAFFIELKANGLQKARISVAIKGTKETKYLVDKLSEIYQKYN